ncbi:MAG: glycosyltransferase family 39 protein [Bacteroidia bacterium]|nr:glycosyltransferase family 39 protein [Bacteroidia bacterium]
MNRETIRDQGWLGLVMAAATVLWLDAPPLFDWDEINFAESAREMLVTGDFFRVRINYQPFWEKPPLFFWMQALCMAVLGTGELAARLPNAIFGVITVLTLYQKGLIIKDILLARLLALLYMASMLPMIYSKSGIIDPVFNYFIFLGILHLYHYEIGQQRHHPVWAGLWIGIATLTKGPVALLVTGLVYGLYVMIYRRKQIPWVAAGIFGLAWAVPVIGWYGLETAVHGWWFLEKFIAYQAELFTQGVAGHEQPVYYHILVFLPGCFPMAAFVFRAMWHKTETPEDQVLHRIMLIWFWVVLVVFSLATTKIVHYASLLYVPSVFLSALWLHHLIQTGARLRAESWVILGLGILVWGGGSLALGWATRHRETLAGWIADPLGQASLQVAVPWTGYEGLIGLGFVLGAGYGLWLLARRRYLTYLMVQAAVTLVFLNLHMRFTVPLIAQHTQGAPMAFFSKLEGQDVYVATASYKSYLPYFYARVRPGDLRASDMTWLQSGDIDKPVYLAAKTHQITPSFRETYSQFQWQYDAGGFSFFCRLPAH